MPSIALSCHGCSKATIRRRPAATPMSPLASRLSVTVQWRRSRDGPMSWQSSSDPEASRQQSPDEAPEDEDLLAEPPPVVVGIDARILHTGRPALAVVVRGPEQHVPDGE